MRIFSLLLVMALTAFGTAPLAEACTGSPPEAVFDVEVVVEKGGVETGRFPAGFTWSPGGSCSSPPNVLDPPQFDGSFAHWGSKALNVRAGRLVEVVPGHLAEGKIAARTPDGRELLLQDLTTAMDKKLVAPSSGTFFPGNEGAAAAVTVKDGRKAYSVFDFVREEWKMENVTPAGVPDEAHVFAVNPNWLVLVSPIREVRPLFWVVSVANGTARGPFSWWADQGTGRGMDALQNVGLLGDRVYLRQATGGTGSLPGWDFWSLKLPEGNETQHGAPGERVVDGWSVHFAKRYIKSIPSTPSQSPSLDRCGSEPSLPACTPGKVPLETSKSAASISVAPVLLAALALIRRSR